MSTVIYGMMADMVLHCMYIVCDVLNSPCWHIGCETGTVISIDKLGCASDVFPLGWSSATWESGRMRKAKLVNLSLAKVTKKKSHGGRVSTKKINFCCPTLALTLWLTSPVQGRNLAHKFLRNMERSCLSQNTYTHKQTQRYPWHAVPMTEQSRRRLVVSPSPESRGLSLQDGGRGIRRPMGRWNLRRRGSTVTTGLKFAWLPSSFATSSSGTGWAWVWK